MYEHPYAGAATMRTAASVTVHLPSHSSTQTATTRPNLSVMSALPTSRESPVDLVSDFESPQYSPISDADDDEEEPEPEVLTGDHDTIVRAHAFMLLGKKNAKGCDKHVPGSKADKTCSYTSKL